MWWDAARGKLGRIFHRDCGQLALHHLIKDVAQVVVRRNGRRMQFDVSLRHAVPRRLWEGIQVGEGQHAVRLAVFLHHLIGLEGYNPSRCEDPQSLLGTGVPADPIQDFADRRVGDREMDRRRIGSVHRCRAGRLHPLHETLISGGVTTMYRSMTNTRSENRSESTAAEILSSRSGAISPTPLAISPVAKVNGLSKRAMWAPITAPFSHPIGAMPTMAAIV